MNIPRDHHYAPQFYLRNFSTDEGKRTIATVAKHGDMAIWSNRSIQNVGYEKDFYVHMKNGVPVSVETDINENIENPISRSKTWQKISNGNTEDLDQSDRGILYALIRHLEARTPHYLATLNELMQMEDSGEDGIEFSEEEKEMYKEFRENPHLAKTMMNMMASSLQWTAKSVESSFLMILRSPIPLRTSTTPTISITAPHHPNMDLPVPGMAPYQLVLALNPSTIACLVLGDFDGHFSNEIMDLQTALGFNSHYLAHFAKFQNVRHLVTEKAGLVDEMLWAHYDLISDTEKKITFKRKIIGC